MKKVIFLIIQLKEKLNKYFEVGRGKYTVVDSMQGRTRRHSEI